MDLLRVIESTRQRVRYGQRSYNDGRWRADRFKKPFSYWLTFDFRFDRQIRDQRILLERGNVVWGAIIQANQDLFQPRGQFAILPAAIIYSADPVYDADIGLLIAQAHSMYDLKGRTCTPEMQAFGNKLANEMVADIKLPIPTGFTDGVQCYYSTLLIPRAHLPENHLANGFFPILIAPQETKAVMVLPKWYWDPELTEAWSES